MAEKRKKSKPLSAAAEKYIQNQAAKSRFTPGQLRQVYGRGQGAYLSSGSRPGVSMEAWARGRVKSFVSGKGGARKADSDLMRKKK